LTSQKGLAELIIGSENPDRSVFQFFRKIPDIFLTNEDSIASFVIFVFSCSIRTPDFISTIFLKVASSSK
jgi:hypothetical protein